MVTVTLATSYPSEGTVSPTALVFSPAGVTVLALTTPRMAHDYFYDIVCHKGGHYRGLQGISTDPQPDIGSDFSVDPAMVTAGLDWAELACGDD